MGPSKEVDGHLPPLALTRKYIVHCLEVAEFFRSSRVGKNREKTVTPWTTHIHGAYPPTPAEERGSAPGITGVGVLTMDAGACESLVARSVPVLRFTGYGWARMY